MSRSAILWAVSALLLAWIVLQTALSFRIQACRDDGGAWDIQRWRCRVAPAIELKRELNRT